MQGLGSMAGSSRALRICKGILRGSYFYASWSFSDFVDTVRGFRVPTPPEEIRVRVGPFRSAILYRASGKQFVSHIKELCQLSPHERVLDVGCGSGRLAGALLPYLSDQGSYEGFDIARDLIQSCIDGMESHPNFHFQQADVFSDVYNPGGTYKASEFRFPYPDDSFDVVIAASIFTHLLPADVENYLREISRVLKKNGRCLITYFLLNDESRRLTDEGLGSLRFRFPVENARALDERRPEEGVAYPEEFILGLYESNRLRVAKPVRYGGWCGRSRRFKWAYQDMISAVKP